MINGKCEKNWLSKGLRLYVVNFKLIIINNINEFQINFIAQISLAKVKYFQNNR